MNEEVRKKSLSYSMKDGIAWSVNSGIGASYMTPYALALNANEIQIGLLTSIPNLIANVSQLKTPRLMEKTSRKKIVTNCVLVQALIWLPIMLVAFLSLFLKVGFIAPMLVILMYTFFLLMGSLAGPAWSSWMGDLVQEKERGRYFGKRNMIVGITGLLAMLIGGFLLDIFKRVEVLFGFITIFTIAMMARLVSWYFLRKQHEPDFTYKHEYYFSFLDFVKKVKDNNFGRFTIYITLFTLVVNLSSPFVAVYILQELKFSYLVFVIITMSAAFSSVLAMPFWGRFSDRYGNLRTLRVCGLFIPVLPILWLFSQNPVYLAAVESLSGFVWAGFNLAATNFVYDAVTRQRRGICFAYFGALNGIGIFVGATIGGLVATYLKVGFMSTILFLFLISAMLRLGVSSIMLSKIKEVRKVKPAKPLWYFAGDIIRKRLPLNPH